MLRQLTALAFAVSGVVLVAAQPGQAGQAGIPASCDGEAATIVDPTAGADDITGTPGRDVIVSHGGDDTIHSGAGNDLICVITLESDRVQVFSELGNDRVLVEGSGYTGVAAGDGDDTLHADGTGGSALYGQDGKDQLTTLADGYNPLDGGPGNDILRAGPGDNNAWGRGGADRIYLGGEGVDKAYGGPGNDWVRSGGTITDEVHLGSGDDVLVGSNSWLSYDYLTPRAVVVNLALGRATGEGTDRVSGVVALSGTAYADRLLGSYRAERFHGGAGKDTIEARGGADEISPDQGQDVVLAGSGPDTGFFTNDDVWLGPGNDDVTTDLLTRVKGGYGNDVITAHRPRNGVLVSGGPGTDTMDVAVGIPWAGTYGTQVNLTTGRGVVGDWVFDVLGIENVIGTPLADVLIGNGSANVLTGLAGNDTIEGRGGVDTADGGDGVDTCVAEDVISCE